MDSPLGTSTSLASSLRQAVVVAACVFVANGCQLRAREEQPQVRILSRDRILWVAQYPGVDGRFGTEDDRESVGKVFVPVGTKVLCTLVSEDGHYHQLFIPKLKWKEGVVPGYDHQTELPKLDQSDECEIVCVDPGAFGWRHHAKLIALPSADFETQLQQLPHPAPRPAGKKD